MNSTSMRPYGTGSNYPIPKNTGPPPPLWVSGCAFLIWLILLILCVSSFHACGQDIIAEIYDSWHVIEISDNDVSVSIQIFWFGRDGAGYYMHGALDEFWTFEWDWTIDGDEIEIRWSSACDRWGGDEFLTILSDINVTEEFLECKINGVDVVMRRME